jgi:hypothetical protein
MKLIGTLEADYKSLDFSVSSVAQKARALFEKNLLHS